MYQLPTKLAVQWTSLYETMDIRDHLYMGLGCANLLELRILASVY